MFALPYTYKCGCIQHSDHTWTLCGDCGARIGKVGTCLECDGPADEWWTVEGFPNVRSCSPECAERAARDELEDAAAAA
jgi:hypothetical protein